MDNKTAFSSFSPISGVFTFAGQGAKSFTPSEIYPKNGGLVFERRLTVNPSMMENWLIQGIALRIYISYHLQYFLLTEVERKKLEEALVQAKGQSESSQSSFEKAAPGSKEQFENAAVVQHSIWEQRELEGRIETFEMTTAREGLNGPSPVKVIAEILKAGGQQIWLMKSDPAHLPTSLDTRVPPTQEKYTEAAGKFLDIYSVQESLPIPVDVVNGESLILKVTILGPEELTNAAKPNGYALQSDGTNAIAMPFAQIAYQAEPVRFPGQ